MLFTKTTLWTCKRSLTARYIRVDFLEQVILQEIRRLTRCAAQHETEFAELVMGYSKQSAVGGRERKQKELYALRNRDKEIDTLFSRMYEDICCKGRLSKSSNTVKAAGSSVAV